MTRLDELYRAIIEAHEMGVEELMSSNYKAMLAELEAQKLTMRETRITIPIMAKFE